MISPPIKPQELLAVRGLRISFSTLRGTNVTPVEEVSFSMRSGEHTALVGESGSGKSLTALALLGLVPSVGGRVDKESSIKLQGDELVGASEPRLRSVRGGRIAMIFQDPLAALDPVQTVGYQIRETLRVHRPEIDPRDHHDHAVELVKLVRLPRPERLVNAYPHELSGGMRQRAMIAAALAGDPALLVADEPTTALDPTVQSAILDLLSELGEQRSLAVLLITHDLSIVAGFADHVLVMYGGRIVESSGTESLYARPHHPYTAALLSSIPSVDRAASRLVAIEGTPPEPSGRPDGCAFHPRCEHAVQRCASEQPRHMQIDDTTASTYVACHRSTELKLSVSGARATIHQPAAASELTDVLLEVRGLRKVYRTGGLGRRSHRLVALDNVTLDVFQGEALGLVGESGSGKTTLARCLTRLIEPTAGEVRFSGTDLLALSKRRLRRQRVNMQMVFQDPASSMDPRFTVRRILAEPLRIHGRWGQPGYDDSRLIELVSLVQLPSDSLDRYPHQFSGGQRQRISIARALALRPSLLVCDEPVSALDVSVRSSVLNLLVDLRRQLGITLVFVAHDLALVRYLCDRIAVMHEGRLVELQATEPLFASPQHAHTQELLRAQPRPDPVGERERRRLRMLAGGIEPMGERTLARAGVGEAQGPA